MTLSAAYVDSEGGGPPSLNLQVRARVINGSKSQPPWKAASQLIGKGRGAEDADATNSA
ncbi:hypothetical protein [Rhodoferax sp. PAMC 29310]|uniref:hypothetical protein n=1 Tax=Rhodoferax sp. PAMC 29310 TaxID=2822760 RepID=UPI001B3327AC|nr:hypothetical protein [Rhodoferax sp. PAMC 29310]